MQDKDEGSSQDASDSDKTSPSQSSNEADAGDVKQANSATEDSNSEPDENNEPATPDWFMKDKFKTIDDQAKSYKELSTKMGKFWGSPNEGYKIDSLDFLEEGDPLIAALTPALQELGLSQEGFNHLATTYMNANREMVKGLEENLKKTLTTTDAHTYQAIDKWMNDNLSAEEANMVKNNWLMSPEDFKLFNQLRLMAAPSSNVPSGAQNAVKFESSKEVENDKVTYRKEVKSGLRAKDKNYENDLSSRYRDAVARELRQKGR